MSTEKDEALEKEFHVPFRVTVQGKLTVVAPDAETAKQIANSGEWDDLPCLSCVCFTAVASPSG